MLYNSVPTDAHELDDLHNTISNDGILTNNVSITPAIIRQCVTKLKPDKGDGDRGFKSDHLIHSTHRFHVISALLFNNMLVHGYTPEDLLKSSIISIPKDNIASLTNSDNYRGNSLFNSIFKLLDNIISLLYGNDLQSSDMQFDFKQGQSTTLCSLIYKEVVNHYLNGDSNVYCNDLDASKAFDMVYCGALFKLLLKKKIIRYIIRSILDSYIRQTS